MPDIKAFKGFFYNTEAVGNIDEVVAPPYDVINSSQRETLYQKSPFNIVRLILGKDEAADNEAVNKYSRAADFIKDWLNKGILKEDAQNCLYLLEQEFEYENKKYSRIGFFALVRLVEFGRGEIYPHEETLSAPKADRLKLFEAVRANFSPVFSFYVDDANTVENIFEQIKKKPAFLSAVGTDKVKNNLWKITDEKLISNIRDVLKNRQVFIADGHHRYETALNFKKLHPPRDENDKVNFTLMYFANTEQNGLVIFPTHRAVKKIPFKDKGEFRRKIEEFFDMRDMPDLSKTLKTVNAACGRNEFGLFFGGKFSVLSLKDEAKSTGLFLSAIDKSKSEAYRALDVTVLDKFLIKKVLDAGTEGNIDFIKDAGEAVALIEKGEYSAAFFLKATSLSQVKEIALCGQRMPKKSTYFHPKLLSGLIVNRF